MIITLKNNSYTIADVAISNISHKCNKLSIYYLLASVVIWLLFVPHLESFLCVTRIAIAVITIASGVILADLEDEIMGRTIQLVFNLIVRKVTF